MIVVFNKPLVKYWTAVMFLICVVPAFAQSVLRPGCDNICGKWMLAEKNLTVQVYREAGEFKAKIIWFDDSDDRTRPMELRKDSDNPDVKMRDKLILGSNVLTKLVYRPDSNSWENGVIYDAKHGRYWDSSAYITADGLLKVTGYWRFKFIGKTLTFTRLN